jgi:ABC-2 type transport system permease protein
MSRFLALLRKLALEVRWILGLNVATMFLFGWLNTYFTARRMDRIRELIETGEGRGASIVQSIGGQDAVLSVATIEITFWFVPPFLFLPVVIWAIGRGSLSVAGELERGTLDLVLSRPISRFAYLLGQLAVAVLGLAVLVAALVAGNRLSTNFNRVDGAPTAAELAGPALNLAALGFAVLGITMAASSLARVRWPATAVGTVVTLGGFVAWVFAHLREMEGSPLRPWFQAVALFELYNPVDAVSTRALLGRNLLILGGLGLAGVAAAFAAFLRRDLPTNG